MATISYAVAAPHIAASEAGRDAFERGGNAVDAALAAAAVLAVVYPHMCTVGGDLFALLHAPGGETTAYNASGASPSALDIDALRASHRYMPMRGPYTVTVPGVLSGWAALARRSRFGLAPPLETCRHLRG